MTIYYKPFTTAMAERSKTVFDPSKTDAENAADLQAQFAAVDKEYYAKVMAHFDLSDAEWDVLPAKVKVILGDYYEAAL